MTTAADLAQRTFYQRDLRGLRASELARCPRMCAYRATDPNAAREPSDLELRYFSRGRMFGRFVAEQLAIRYGQDNVEFEKPIPWEHGTAHPDIYVKSERLFIEVKSTTAPSALTFDMAVAQVRIYMRLQERADEAALATGESRYRGQVYIINPSALTRDDAIPVRLNDYDRKLIDQSILDLTRAAEGGPLPDRVCRKPSDGRSRLCPFVDTCFQDWEPDIRQVDDDALVRLAQRHYYLAEDERRARKAADELKAERQQVEADIADRIKPGEYRCGQLILRRTHVAARERFAINKARTAGFDLPEELEPFVSLVGEHDRYSTRVAEGETVLPYDDNDEVPF